MLASEISRSPKLDELIRTRGSTSLGDFVKFLQESPVGDIETFLAGRRAVGPAELAELVAVELRHRLTLKQPYRIEHFLRRFPDLGADREQVLDLIYAEFCERRRHDAKTDSQEYYERFPSLRDSLERMFRMDGLFQGGLLSGNPSESDHEAMPNEGDRFLDFQLKVTLGRGSFGVVFLAEQETLSNRRVVVKISSRPTIEHRTMARLEHSNIVPILSVHREDRTEFQAVCMPYQHAVALSDLREGWTAQTLGDNRAETYLRSVRDALPERLPSDADAVAEFPARQDFVYATAWIMHKLAGALNHAHLRGIYHRDLKPSNILLTASGQPLLVDFNLSFDRLESASSNAKMVGGTLAYMPAEQIQALHPIEPGRVDDVGPRADIFSLAVTVFEMLTGRLPFGAPTREADKLAALLSQLAKRFTAVPNVREFNPLVPPDLADLIAKCLDPLPHRRYDTAAVLADDLARFLQDRPMRHVPMIPWRSRLRKFTRRNRRRLLSSAAITTAVAAASIAIAHSYHRAHIERVARKHSDLLASQLQTNADKEADQALARRLKVPDDGQNFYRSFVLGREYFLARRYGVALRCFTVSRSLREDYAPTYFYRARSLANLDMDDEALKDFSKAIDLDPNDLYSFLARAVFYASSVTHADPYQALADIEMAQQLMPRTEVERNKALYLEMARVFSAVSRLVVADEREPILIKAEENLVKALQLGLEVHFVNEAAASDRFRMLGPVLNRPRMASLLSELSLSEEKH